MAAQHAGGTATRWLPATQARLGLTGEARAFIAALDDEQASSGEIRNALAVTCLAERNPTGGRPGPVARR